MNWYGEAVLLREFGKIPDDVRRIYMPQWISSHFGEAYHVSVVDAALLRGAYAKAKELVEKDNRNCFKKIIYNNGEHCPPSLELEVIQEAVESQLKERYVRKACGFRRICELFEKKNVMNRKC